MLIFKLEETDSFRGRIFSTADFHVLIKKEIL